MNNLFETPLAMSPHAAWLADHDLVVREYQHVHSLNRNGYRFICCNRAMTRWAGADTEDEAERKYAEMYCIDWWKLAEWNVAMGPALSAATVHGDGMTIHVELVDEEMSLG